MANPSTIRTEFSCPIQGPRGSRRSGAPATSWPRRFVAALFRCLTGSRLPTRMASRFWRCRSARWSRLRIESWALLDLCGRAPENVLAGAIDKAANVPKIRPSTLLIILLGLLLTPASALAQPDEAVVKADFIPKFARYVQWPANVHPSSSQPFQ